MTSDEMNTIAKDIDAVTKILAEIEILRTATPQGAAMALALAAASYVVHTSGTKQDFMNLVNAAWERAKKAH